MKEIFHIPVSLVVERIVLKALNAMTYVIALYSWGSGCTESIPAGPGQTPCGNQGASPRKTLEILHFMLPKIAQKTTLAFHFLLCS